MWCVIREWFQSGTRVLTTDKSNSLMEATEEKVAKIRSSIEMRETGPDFQN